MRAARVRGSKRAGTICAGAMLCATGVCHVWLFDAEPSERGRSVPPFGAVMKAKMFMCAAAAATALVARLEQGQAFSPGSGIARAQRELVLVQSQDPNAMYRGIGVVTEVDAATGALT